VAISAVSSNALDGACAAEAGTFGRASAEVEPDATGALSGASLLGEPAARNASVNSPISSFGAALGAAGEADAGVSAGGAAFDCEASSPFAAMNMLVNSPLTGALLGAAAAGASACGVGVDGGGGASPVDAM